MAQKKKVSINSNAILMAVVMLVLGILFIVMKGGVLSIAMTVLGVALLVVAVIDLINKQWVPCIIKAVLGIVVIVFGWALIDISRYVLAGVLLIYGVLQIIEAFKGFKKKTSFLSKLFSLLEALVIVAIAVLLFRNTSILWIVGGIFFIVEGVLSLIKALT